ncbi:MAG: hypothetical protein AB8I08_40425 [Sandaracinaceae bacterium]
MRNWILAAVLLVGCGASSTGSSGDLAIPAMRFVQDGTPFGTLHSDGRVSLAGGEHVATVHPNGQVVDHSGASVFALTSGGNIVFSDGRDPMRLLDGQLAYGPDAVLTVDEAGNFQLGEQLVGVFVEGFVPEFTEQAFLGWLALQVAPIPLRRDQAAEAEATLEALYAQLVAHVGENAALPPASARVPADVACAPSEALSTSQHPLFASLPDGERRFAYSFDVTGSAFVLRAEADLDCDGATSRYELHGQLSGGEVSREPLLRVQAALE